MTANRQFAARRLSVAALLAGGLLLLSTASPVRAAAPRSLELTYDSIMDMVRPDLRPGIAIHHNLQIVVTDQQVTEDRSRNYRSLSDRDAMSQQIGSPSETYVTWDVMGPTKFVRTERDPQSIRTMNISINPDNTCRLEVTDALKPGFSDYKFSRIGTRRPDGPPMYAYFSTYRVTQTSCVIR